MWRWLLAVVSLSNSCRPAARPLRQARLPMSSGITAVPAPHRAVPVRPQPLRMVRLVSSAQYRCALGSNGRVRCWGRVLGSVAATPRELPIRDVVDLDVVDTVVGSIAVVTTDGTLLMTDANSPAPFESLAHGIRRVRFFGSFQGALIRTDGTLAEFSTRFDADKKTTTLESTTVRGLSQVVDVADAGGMQCALVASGAVTCWEDPSDLHPIEGITDAVALSRGDHDDLCAQLRTGPPRCWDGGFRAAPSDAGEDVVQVVGGRANAFHRCARTSSGAVRCIGRNRSGEAGIGHKSPRVAAWTRVPLPVPAVDVVVSWAGTCALLGDGSVECWGDNADGEIGDGTRIDRPSPVRVVGLLDDPLPTVRDGLSSVGESDVQMDWTGLPHGCSKPTDMIDLKTGEDFPIVSAYGWIKEEELSIALGDYRIEPLAPDAAARGSQHRIELRFVRAGDGWPLPVNRGEYSAADGAKRRISVFQGDTLTGLVETTDARGRIIHIDKDWVCGTVDLRGKRGVRPFAARIVPDDE